MVEANRGRVCTEQARKNMSKAQKGRIPWNKGTVGVMKAWNKGLKTGHNSYKNRYKDQVKLEF